MRQIILLLLCFLSLGAADLETFTLQDGRVLTGRYNQATGTILVSVPVKKQDIVKREPIKDPLVKEKPDPFKALVELDEKLDAKGIQKFIDDIPGKKRRELDEMPEYLRGDWYGLSRKAGVADPLLFTVTDRMNRIFDYDARAGGKPGDLQRFSGLYQTETNDGVIIEAMLQTPFGNVIKLVWVRSGDCLIEISVMDQNRTGSWLNEYRIK